MTSIADSVWTATNINRCGMKDGDLASLGSENDLYWYLWLCSKGNGMVGRTAWKRSFKIFFFGRVHWIGVSQPHGCLCVYLNKRQFIWLFCLFIIILTSRWSITPPVNSDVHLVRQNTSPIWRLIFLLTLPTSNREETQGEESKYT
jgi:hypothetical protein